MRGYLAANSHYYQPLHSMLELDDNNSEKSLNEINSEESESNDSNVNNDSDWSEVDTALNYRNLEHVNSSTIV